ncbi:spermidine sinapoyl-CoA acyltransferase [Juglans microcarpa x Juglans regia]|uniref:spermidine sinapoyl-CoA acyltransferase n=1 Tax=Juglans microcarpa x Juglans regia TaxID=2249226 RepID=UPI001B7F1DD1|nr:spermidine sinapoyl-CoA acyltransferase [Juglans microcarpa x Juglans regia]
MHVKISNTTLVSPSPQPFEKDHVLSLSHLDTDPNLNVTFRYLRVYLNTPACTPSSNDPFHVISTALSSALVLYYPLAATLRLRHSDNRLELFCSPGQTVPLVHAAVDCTLDSLNYLDDADAQFVEKLVPDPNPDDGLVDPCMLQVTVFNCGGFTLGAAIHHSLCDGLGATQFFNAMAELARGANRVSVGPVWDRASLLGPRKPPRVEAPVHEFLTLDKGFSPYSQAKIGPVVREWIPVRDKCLDRFKTVLFERSGSKFTTFEALGAFIWRAKVKASGVPGDEQVKFAYSINMRKQVEPPLPIGYWGNGCVAMYVQLSAEELLDKPIWETADLIRKSKSKATDEYVRSFIDFQELHYGDGITVGKGVSGFTDWRHLGHSTVDFGWGGPVTVLPLSRNLLGSVEPCFFLPYSSASAGISTDGFKVQVTLEESAMPAFREEMKKFSSSSQEFGSSRY